MLQRVSEAEGALRTVFAGALLGLGIAFMLPLAASATNSATATVATSASVTANCKITTVPIAFGAYDPLIANNTLAAVAQAPETVYCTKGSYPTVNVGSSAGLMKINPSDSTGLSYTYSLTAPNFGTSQVQTGTQQVQTGTQQVQTGSYPVYAEGSYTYSYSCGTADTETCYGTEYYEYVAYYAPIYTTEPVYSTEPVYTTVQNPAVSSGISNGITWMLSASVPGGQDMPVGVYQDTITVTLNF